MNLEKLAFGFVEEIEAVEDIQQLEKLLADYVAPFGADFFLAGQLVFPGGYIKPTRLFGVFDCDWFRYYDQFHLILEDPAARHLSCAVKPFTWSWVIQNYDLSAGEEFVMHEPGNFGLSDGLVIPVFGPNRALGCVTIAGENFKPCRVEVAALQMMTTAAYNHALHVTHFFERASQPTLSSRQRECLNWLQHGKSNADIADILGISPHTVKEHINAARTALGVATRMEAVVEARRANLIGP